MSPPSWLHVLSAEIPMAPGFRAALDQQLRREAQRLAGVDLASGDFALLPPDGGFAVQFHTTGGTVVGVIEGMLVDPSAFGHPVALGWRATGAADRPIQPDHERDDLEFVWLQFPIAELSAGTRVDARATAAAVTAAFPIEWDVHHWASASLVLHAHRAFTAEDQAALVAVVRGAIADWNARAPRKIHYLADPELAADRATLRLYVDLGSAGSAAVVAVLDALGAAPAARAIARCTVGRQRPQRG